MREIPKLREALAAIARRDHFRWYNASRQWVTKRAMLDSYHLRLMSHQIDRLCAGEINRLLINMPPRHGKTECSVVALASRIMAVNPRAKIMHGSYGQGLVEKNSRKVLSIAGTQQFKDCFPSFRLSTKSRSVRHWETTLGGEFHAVSTQSEVTGFECGDSGAPFDGMLIIDDPEKAADMSSPPYRNKMKDNVGQMIATRINHDDTPVLVVQQRLHSDDISNWLMSGGTGDRWTVLCLQAISQTGRPPEHYQDYSHVDLVDYQRNPGALWPARRSERALLQIRDAKENQDGEEPRGARVFQAQYQQAPGDASLALYEKDWMARYNESDIPDTMSELFLRLDTAQKGAGNADGNGLVLFGYDRRTPDQIFVLDAAMRRCEFPKLVEWLADYCERIWDMQTTSLRFTQLTIEDANIGPAVKAVLDIELKKRGVICRINLTPSYGGKVARAMEASPFFQQGQVLFPSGRTRFQKHDEHNALALLETEFATFNELDTHASDDVIDNVVWEVVTRWGNAPGGKGFAYGG